MSASACSVLALATLGDIRRDLLPSTAAAIVSTIGLSPDAMATLGPVTAALMDGDWDAIPTALVSATTAGAVFMVSTLAAPPFGLAFSLASSLISGLGGPAAAKERTAAEVQLQVAEAVRWRDPFGTGVGGAVVPVDLFRSYRHIGRGSPMDGDDRTFGTGKATPFVDAGYASTMPFTGWAICRLAGLTHVSSPENLPDGWSADATPGRVTPLIRRAIGTLVRAICDDDVITHPSKRGATDGGTLAWLVILDLLSAEMRRGRFSYDDLPTCVNAAYRPFGVEGLRIALLDRERTLRPYYTFESQT